MTAANVVTGGASGIGAGLVRSLAAEEPGSVCVVLDADAHGLESLRAELGSDRMVGLRVDIANREEVQRSARAIRERGLVPATLTHCAGYAARWPSLELSEVEWRRMLGVHLDGALWAVQAFVPAMPAGGSVLLMSSVAGRFGWPGRLTYAVAKSGLESMIRTLAVELVERDIRVNGLAPGYVNTPFVERAVDEGVFDRAEAEEKHVLRRFAEVQEIVEAARFLLSGRASFVTGQTMLVDGGFSIQK